MTTLQVIQEFPNLPQPMSVFQQAIKDKNLYVNGKKVKKETDEFKDDEIIEEVRIGDEVLYKL